MMNTITTTDVYNLLQDNFISVSEDQIKLHHNIIKKVDGKDTTVSFLTIFKDDGKDYWLTVKVIEKHTPFQSFMWMPEFIRFSTEGGK